MKNLAVLLISLSAVVALPILAQNKLEEITVTSSRTEMPLRQVGASVSVVSQHDIDLLGSLSLAELLRNEVGIAVSNSGGAGKVTSLRIRGEESYRTLVMIDGMDVSDPTAPQGGPLIQDVINSGGIARVEVLRGPQGFIYGADAGGVINVFTRNENDGLAGELSAEYGRYDSSNINGYIAAGDEQTDMYLSVAKQNTDGFNSRTVDLGGDDDGYNNTTVHGKFGWNIAEALRAQVVVRDVESDSEFDGSFDADTHNRRSTFDQRIARLSFAFADDGLTSSMAVSRSDIMRESIADDIATFITEGETEKFEYLGSMDLSTSMKIVIGLGKEKEKIEREVLSDLTRSQAGVFGELQAKLNDTIYVTAGARYDDSDDFGEHTSLRITGAYVYALNDDADLKFRASVGSGFRAPSLSEIAYNDGPNAFGAAADIVLAEEQSKGIDVGLEYYTNNGTEIGLTYFYQYIDDEIFFDLIEFSGYLQADGESHSEGVELSIDYPLTHYAALHANASYNKTETLADLPRIRRPERLANIGAEFSLLENALTVLVNLRVVQNSVNEIFGMGRVDLDDYELLNISGNYAVTSQLEFFARIENVTNSDYQEVTTYTTSGSAAYGGVRFAF